MCSDTTATHKNVLLEIYCPTFAKSKTLRLTILTCFYLSWATECSLFLFLHTLYESMSLNTDILCSVESNYM